MSKTNITTAAKAIQYFNSRKPIDMRLATEGAQTVLMVQGDGTLITAADQKASDIAAKREVRKQYFDSYIHNLNANSMEAVSRADNKQLLKDAMAEEAAGNAETADVMFTQWLNNVQISFNVIADASRRKYANGDQVKVTLGTAVTKAGHTAIVIDKHAYVAPVVVAKQKFDITELAG